MRYYSYRPVASGLQTVFQAVNWSDFSPCFTLRAAFAALLFYCFGYHFHETVEVNLFLRNALRNSAKATILKA